MSRDAVDAGAFWGKGPEPTGADLEWEKRQQAFRDEAEAAKTPEQKAAEKAEEEATKNADAALVAESLGTVVRRPNGMWRSAAEHHVAAEKQWARAYALRCASERRRLHANRPLPPVAGGRRGVLRRTVSARRNPRTQRRRTRAPASKEGSDEHDVALVAVVRLLAHERRRFKTSHLRGVA